MAGPRSEAVDLAALEASVGQPDALQCCCGNTDCHFLKHNCSVLNSVERDVHTAARLGQALLARHEALMASAETERFEMQSRIDQLETDKKSLEAENARTIQENRALLDQLESLNSSVADSETHIKSLEATLQSTEQSLRKLERAELRANELETQLSVVEAEQAELHNTLVTTQAEARSAMQRWHKAEKGISELQEKLERIEREAREERDRHSDMVERMEKQRAMEKDLYTAAGRLKGAAAAKTIGDGKNGGTVVSHFVRDLLSDNANLQLGIAELRELLMNSNDEIQHLREQLMFHQPADDDDGLDPKTPRSPKQPHRPEPTPSVSQELHIHHHYHVTRPVEPKKPLKKKRQGLTPNIFTPSRPFSPSGASSPAQWRLEHSATSPGFVSHSVKESISTIPSTRWSVFSDQPSDFASSSVPSSPMSTHHRRISVFDQDYDSPASPATSVDPNSPAWTKHYRASHNHDTGARTFSTPRPLYLGDVPEDEPHRESNERLITDVSQCTPQLSASTSPDASTGNPSDGALSMPLTPSFDDSFVGSRPRLHRVSSQESIMSLSGGLDIHTLKVRPGQLALRPLGSVSAETELSAVIARPTIARGKTDGKRGSVVLRDNLLNLPNLVISVEAPSPTGSEHTPQRQSSASSGFGRIVSWRPWGGKNSNHNSPNTATEQASSEASTPAPSERARSTGTIPGFSAYWAAHQMKGPTAQVVPQNVDTEALREGLEE
ncbi:hypothetical protein M406DRAFT_267840 [Cryphonectria parasitica EP155]|uniref:Uncharacterized protein n=1 Tax=Cryphonectria parasitica (strain ATCC 38755 / EP155) TaxID=660469 RepID=A0A9P4XUA1_CRYP1|nr:uncharacterized protein M406DRAFT_267840 [Cryphonectria parasitica EP155]KAF3760887.1 hypothetical protein M406DRAFT_267840 [Cryphonectria parasitica EP155]